MKRIKALLIDLPAFIGNLSRVGRRNDHIPLACAYLKAYAQAKGLLEEADIDIAPEALMNFGGDYALITYILEKGYDLVGFSLYQWNAFRSLHIMREVKRRNPSVIFVAGGPEVSLETEYLMEDEVLDFLIRGEGEEPFRRLLLHLIDGSCELEDIAGLVYRHRGSMRICGPPEALGDIAHIPSPYLLGIIDPAKYGYLFIETLRGCPFSCRYCSWKGGGRHRVSMFPFDRIRQELRLARERGIYQVSLADSGTNVSRKWLKDLCAAIRMENEDHFLQIHTYIHPELVNEESARWLAEANFKNPIIGLQTVNRRALKAIGRHANLDAYIKGSELLDRYGVGFRSTIILGLPEDTPEGFRETVDFLLKHNQKSVICFPLSVAPNTIFRSEAESFGIKFQQAPPNYVISTPTMQYSDIRTCITLFREEFSHPFGGTFGNDIRYHSRVNFPRGHYSYGIDTPSFRTYAQGRYPYKAGETEAMDLEKALLSEEPEPLTRIFFSPGSRNGDEAEISRMAAMLAPRLSWNCLVWIRDFEPERDDLFLQRLLAALSCHNRHTVWNIVIEFNKESSLVFLDRLPSSIAALPNLLDYESIYDQEEPVKDYCTIGPFIYAVIPYGSEAFSDSWIDELDRRLPFFWSYTYPEPVRSIPDKGAGLVMDFAPGSQPSQILYMLNMLRYLKGHWIYAFRNIVMERLWGLFCKNEIHMFWSYDTMLDFIGSGRVSKTVCSREFLRTHFAGWNNAAKGIYDV